MATLRITSTQASPSTEFRLFADATIDSANRRWKILAYITCINRGDTSSYYGGSGTHKGYVNGTLFRTHSGTPFLPSGVSGGGTRWNEGPYTVYVDAPTNGQKTIALRMTMDYGGVSYDNSVNLVLPDMGYAAPSVPTGLSPVAASSSQINVSWAASTGRVTGYRISYRKVGDAAWTYVTDTASPYSLTGLAKATQYEFRIQAYNEDNSSAYTASAYATTEATAPSAPQGLSVGSTAAGAFTASFTAPADNGGKAISSYDLQFRAVGDSSWTVITGVTSPYTRTGLTAGGSYEVQVRAKNADATGAWSATVPVVTDAGKPSTLAAPSLSAASGVVTATWGAPASTGGKPVTYDLQYRVNNGSWTVLTDVTSPKSLPAQAPGSSVDVQVRAKNVDATGDWSATKNIVVSGTGGKPWDGSSFVPNTGKVWNGTAFVDPIYKVWNGSAFVDMM